ncbi:MAG TPA: hypothetical protein VGM72_13445 [Micropepsaceae bacterium]
MTLSGCASMEAAPARSASLQNAIYVGGDTATVKPMNAASDGQKPAVPPGEPKAMRFYWFLGGR